MVGKHNYHSHLCDFLLCYLFFFIYLVYARSLSALILIFLYYKKPYTLTFLFFVTSKNLHNLKQTTPPPSIECHLLHRYSPRPVTGQHFSNDDLIHHAENLASNLTSLYLHTISLFSRSPQFGCFFSPQRRASSIGSESFVRITQ